MANSYDAILIGAGHNGLVAAAYLAKAGQRVLVLERRPVVGGAATTEEVYPGFKYDVCAHRGRLREAVVRELELGRHGLEVTEGAWSVFSPLPDGGHLLLDDGPRTTESIARFSRADADQWPAFRAFATQMGEFLARVQDLTPPRISHLEGGELMPLASLGLSLRRMGDREMVEALRVLPMSMAEFLGEWFEGDGLKGTLGAGGITGIHQGPLSAGTAYVFLHHLASGQGFTRADGVVRGGIGKLAEALASAAKAHGAEIRTGAEVAQASVRGGRVTGVVLSNGEEIPARFVLSNADPRRTFLGLVDAGELDPPFIRQVQNIKFRGVVAKVNLALAELPRFEGLSGEDTSSALRGTISISPSLEYLERAYDDAKYGRFSQRPYLEIRIPSLGDPSLAPAGKHVMSIYVQYAPYRLKAGNWANSREAVGQAVLDTLAQYAPNVHGAVLHQQVLTPADLEAGYGLTEGNIYHGELTLDQVFIMRPVPGWAQYRTPIEGLYLCGAGTHPGGGLSGVSGRNAAREVLKDMKRTCDPPSKWFLTS